MAPLVAGVDSSTQSCKVLVVDADRGHVVRRGQSPHPDGTEVDPKSWFDALETAASLAGDIEDCSAVSVAGQQHGMVCLDESGGEVRPALLWNDTRSAEAAADLTRELGGPQAWAAAVGLVPVASFTVAKLRWLATHEPDNAARTATVALPHDYLTWRLSGRQAIETLVTDRSDASGTGYWSPLTESYRDDLLVLALGNAPRVPRVLGPSEVAGHHHATGALLGPGAGDNAAAALGLGAGVGDVVVSIGTSGVACAVSTAPTQDATGTVAGFADATGRYLPLVATLNAARTLDAAARLLGVDHGRLSDLALSVPDGAGGLALIPFLEGERTPNRPRSAGALHGMTLANTTPAHVARAAVEAILCGLADALDVVEGTGCPVRRVLLIGGGARSEAVRVVAPRVLARPVVVPEPHEFVALGAARQAAWVLTGSLHDWELRGAQTYEADPAPHVRERYAEARDLTIDRH